MGDRPATQQRTFGVAAVLGIRQENRANILKSTTQKLKFEI